MMPPAIKRRMLVQLFGGSPSVALGNSSSDLTTRIPASFTTDSEKAVQSIPIQFTDLPPETPATHVRVYQGSELQWEASLPEAVVFSTKSNRTEFPTGSMVFYI